MASFEIAHDRSGAVRILTKAINVASKISKEILIEFERNRLRLSARSDHHYVKFSFKSPFFKKYDCTNQHSCCVNIKSLQMPFKAPLWSEKDVQITNPIRLTCNLENEFNQQLVFWVGNDPPSCSLTYRIPINDTDVEKMNEIKAINRKPLYERVVIEPLQSKRDRFLLSALNSFAPDIDLITIKVTRASIRFIGSSHVPLSINNTTSEFSHDRNDFNRYDIKDEVGDHINITIPIKHLKTYLGFVEQSKYAMPKFIFEGVGEPAHFIYEYQDIFSCRFVVTSIPEFAEFEDEPALPIEGANESFIVEENVIDMVDPYHDNNVSFNGEGYEDDGYNENRSDEEFVDGDLERVNLTINDSHTAESIRSEMRDMSFDPQKARQILNLDADPDEMENIEVLYSSDSDDD